LQGEARKEFVALREDIVGCLALVEALIDSGEGEEIAVRRVCSRKVRARRMVVYLSSGAWYCLSIY